MKHLTANIQSISTPARNTAQSNSPSNHRKVVCREQNSLIKRFTRYKIRKPVIIVLYSWLFMNSHPLQTKRFVEALMVSRLLNRALTRPPPDSRGGMSTVEAIALIQAINSGNRGSQQVTDLLPTRPSAVALRQQENYNRQAPVPVPVPLPVPIAVVAAAVAAFFAAVIVGLAPLGAIVAAFFAALFIFVAAILAIKEKKNDKGNKGSKSKSKSSPLIKKLVIKKTVLPFIIPIPYKQKEKEIIYKYVHKPEHHHKEEHEHEYEYKSKKKSDVEPDIVMKKDDGFGKIEKLLKEQDYIQSMLNKVVDESKIESRIGRESIRRIKRSISAMLGG